MRRLPLLASLVLALLVAGPATPLRGLAAADIPARLSDQEFWRLSEELSEPDGTFRSENMISNEMVFARLLPEVIAKAKPGGVYMGVGPEQNFTYLAALKPRIAFITDIRRGNLHVLLMYKALFETSADRAEFIARLFVKPKLSGVSSSSSATDIMNAVWAANTLDEAAFAANLAAIQRHLTRTRSIPLSPEDLDGIARAYRVFFWYGPAINYNATTALTAIGSGRSANYWDLMTQSDADGKGLTYLASEEKFRTVKDMFARNMIVPLVGNFSGPKTIRAIGDWVRARGAQVHAFYVSSVEPYLQRDGTFPTYCASVATLPMNESSVFIRTGNLRGLLPAPAFAAQSDNSPTGRVVVPPVTAASVGQYVTGVVVPMATGCQ